MILKCISGLINTKKKKRKKNSTDFLVILLIHVRYREIKLNKSSLESCFKDKLVSGRFKSKQKKPIANLISDFVLFPSS
jgi:hypothetical protein